MKPGTVLPDGSFLPNTPAIEDIFAALTREGGGGWDALKIDKKGDGKPSPAKQKMDDLMHCYVQIFSTPAGGKVLEHLLDISLRRGTSHPDPMAGFEQEALYGRERKGQNSIVVSILKMIVDGQTLPSPGKTTSRKKKSS